MTKHNAVWFYISSLSLIFGAQLASQRRRLCTPFCGLKTLIFGNIIIIIILRFALKSPPVCVTSSEPNDVFKEAFKDV